MAGSPRIAESMTALKNIVLSRVTCATPLVTRESASMDSGRNFSPADMHLFTSERDRSPTDRARKSPLGRARTTPKREGKTLALRSACSA
eukprot:6132662-Pyramimonas_sp.AAC.1